MHLIASFNRGMVRATGGLLLVLAIGLGTVALANAAGPKILPVEPDGGIGWESGNDLPLPVEPDGGIGTSGAGNDLPLPVEPDGGIGTSGAGDDLPLPVEPDGGIGS